MARRIIFHQLGQENLQIVSPASDDDAGVALAIEKSVMPNTDKWFIVDHTDLPSDRYFRNAWTHSDGKPTIDIDKAKAIKLAAIRRDRNAALDATDKEVAKLTDQGADLTAIRTKRQALRDLPQTVKLDGLSADDLKGLDPLSKI